VIAYQVTGIDHVQLAMPNGRDTEQRAEAMISASSPWWEAPMADGRTEG